MDDGAARGRAITAAASTRRVRGAHFLLQRPGVVVERVQRQLGTKLLADGVHGAIDARLAGVRNVLAGVAVRVAGSAEPGGVIEMTILRFIVYDDQLVCWTVA